MRAIQFRHWKRPKTTCRELKVLGASEDVASQVAGNCRRWWRNSDRLLKTLLTIPYFDRLGVPRLSWPQFLEPPGADPQCRVEGVAAIIAALLMPISLAI